MTSKEIQGLLNTIDNEGFEYSFIGYSAFENVQDKEFHRLRKAYIAAREALADYIGCEE